MRQTLKLHPDSRCDAVTRLEVDIARPRPGVLSLTYVVTGAIGDLYLPPATSPARADELWRRTCFEAFVQPQAGEAYFEFNFAPSSRWAAYRFNGYRIGMSAPSEATEPRVDVRMTSARYEFHVSLELDGLPSLPDDAALRLGIAAIIEETNGRKSYWALTHPPGKADFHHPDGFVYKLARAEP